MNEAKQVIEKIVFETIVKAVIKRIVAALPILGVPVIGPIFSFIVFRLADRIWEEIKIHSAFIYIEMKTDYERDSYDNAVNELKTVLEDERTKEDQEAINEAKEEFKKRLARLVRLK